MSRRRNCGASQRPRGSGRRIGLRTLDVTRRIVRGPQPLFPFGDHALGRVAARRGQPLLDARRLDRGVWIRAWCSTARCARIDRSPAGDRTRVTTEPPFVLCGPTGALVADGVQAWYSDVAAAQSALSSRAVPIVLGALAFDSNDPAA